MNWWNVGCWNDSTIRTLIIFRNSEEDNTDWRIQIQHCPWEIYKQLTNNFLVPSKLRPFLTLASYKLRSFGLGRIPWGYKLRWYPRSSDTSLAELANQQAGPPHAQGLEIQKPLVCVVERARRKSPGGTLRAKDYTPEVATVKFRWKMPLKVHWQSDNPLDDTTDKWNYVGKCRWQSIAKCHWTFTMISKVLISGVQYFAPVRTDTGLADLGFRYRGVFASVLPFRARMPFSFCLCAGSCTRTVLVFIIIMLWSWWLLLVHDYY